MVIREVQDDLVLLQRLDPILTLTDVTLDELHPGRQRGRAIVGGRRQVVEDRDLVPFLEKELAGALANEPGPAGDRKSTRLNSSHGYISYAVFCLKKKKRNTQRSPAPIHQRTPSRASSSKRAPS